MSSGASVDRESVVSAESWNHPDAIKAAEAELLLAELAAVFLNNANGSNVPQAATFPDDRTQDKEEDLTNSETIYRNLVEQIPAVIFRAHLDRGIGEAYVSPQIEASLGFSQEEWLEDPIRWYQQVHPDDKQRWSIEAAEMFLSGKELRSAYRVLARDGRVVWFHCQAKMIRRNNGRPWFIHGIAFDITELKRAEEALQEERNVASAILKTVGALVVVLDPQGKIVRFNRACELISGYSEEDAKDKYFWDLFVMPEEAERFKLVVERLRTGNSAELSSTEYEASWIGRDGSRRLIAWSSTTLPGKDGLPAFVIASGIDITERKRLEKALLEITAQEQRRIGQDLHDGLGQHLTGIAFMSKVQEQKLADKGMAEAAGAARIVALVNEAIHKTRTLAHGLLPVVPDSLGLMSALTRWAAETEEMFHISCRFCARQPVLIHDSDVSTHLYRIAQEAVNNAIKHGEAKNLLITLSAGKEYGQLTIENDGLILSQSKQSSGMGLQIMNYRAHMIGGTLRIDSKAARGVIVTCSFPLPLGKKKD
jgi:PAS domain S-box-containing protein